MGNLSSCRSRAAHSAVVYGRNRNGIPLSIVHSKYSTSAHILIHSTYSPDRILPRQAVLCWALWREGGPRETPLAFSTFSTPSAKCTVCHFLEPSMDSRLPPRWPNCLATSHRICTISTGHLKMPSTPGQQGKAPYPGNSAAPSHSLTSSPYPDNPKVNPREASTMIKRTPINIFDVEKCLLHSLHRLSQRRNAIISDHRNRLSCSTSW